MSGTATPCLVTPTRGPAWAEGLGAGGWVWRQCVGLNPSGPPALSVTPMLLSYHPSLLFLAAAPVPGCPQLRGVAQRSHCVALMPPLWLGPRLSEPSRGLLTWDLSLGFLVQV